MKKIILSAVIALTLLAGCSETPTMYHNPEYKGEVIPIGNNIYFKKVYIQSVAALLQCDKDGNIIHNQNINTSYTNGKSQVAVSVITQKNEQSNQSSNFNFKCTDINDCYNQVLVVRNSLSK